MTHSASRRFWERYAALPEDIRTLADKSYELLKTNPKYPSLHFKKLGKFWSARVGLHHRALAVEVEGGMLWVSVHMQSMTASHRPNQRLENRHAEGRARLMRRPFGSNPYAPKESEQPQNGAHRETVTWRANRQT